jgi:hypothetical protein
MKIVLEYKEFLSEKLLLESLILESNVVYSPKFKNVLSKMKDNNLAKTLLEVENQDLDITANFFDLKIDNDNVVTFTNDRAAQSILRLDKEMVLWNGNRGAWLTNSEANQNIFRRLNYTAPPIGTPVYQPTRTEIGEVISKWQSAKTGKTWAYVKFEGGEGVYNQERLKNAHDDLKKKVFVSSRQEVRIGRAIRTILNAKGITFTDAEIESFVNEFRSILSVMNNVLSRFEIVDGEDLLFWYKRANYEFPHMGNLGSSCQAVGRRDWLEIYIDNPDTVKLLILKSFDSPDKILGRALLWNLEDGRKLMDYIYVSKDSDKGVFKEYARSKGYIIREESNENWVAYTKSKPGGYESYPSVDTMRYWDKESGKISNRSFPGCETIIWDDDGGGGDEDEDYEDED